MTIIQIEISPIHHSKNNIIYILWIKRYFANLPCDMVRQRKMLMIVNQKLYFHLKLKRC